MAMQIVFPGPPTQVDDTARVPVGTVAEDVNGNEYIYLSGVASTVAGDAVVYSGTYTTTRTLAASRGHLAIAKAAVLAAQFGWYAIGGRHVANVAAATAANARVAVIATAGTLGAAAVNQMVIGLTTATAESGGQAEVIMRYPFVGDSNA